MGFNGQVTTYAAPFAPVCRQGKSYFGNPGQYVPDTYQCFGNDLLGSYGAAAGDALQFGTKFFSHDDRDYLRADFKDCQSSYMLYIDTPGAKKDDCSIKCDPATHVLNITVHFKGWESSAQQSKVLWSERPVGYMTRQIKLPADADVNKVCAKEECGILRLAFPKMTGKDVLSMVDIQVQ
ncbi:unnamed protein product (mitochondrion) [Plasmodiophora brassicae]|uniref:SHSP domain-containing protein n=2 Tax=Plasmodiophora brassicae TaxID=37360 RepID=A0A0G4IYW5_PLABS|nr:hypothetical protein PBRA_008033 [Plasmodiophora brassicae]SPQ95080.1 unnamed protein product [Plasmodiophora brassicae]